MSRKLRIIKTRRRVVLLIISFILMIIFSILFYIFSQPNKATIIKKNIQDSGQLDIESGTTTLTGKHFTLEYNTELNVVTDISGQDRNALEAFRLARSTVEDRRILIVTIKDLETGGLSEDSAYKIRTIQPDTYKETTEVINGITFKMMSRTDNEEVVAFAVNGGKLAIIAYTAGASNKTYSNMLGYIDSFHWL